jgi:hypothetical protein
VIEVLTRSEVASGVRKKRKAVISDSFSATVPCRIDLSNFLDDLIKIKNIKDPIKNMIP